MEVAEPDSRNCVVYPRAAVDTSAFDGLNKTIAAGDVAFVERIAPSKRRMETAQSKHIRIYTMEQVNAKFATARITLDDGEVPTGKEIFDRFSLDGIVHAIDGERGEHKDYGEYAVAHTAVLGQCRFAVTAEEAARVKVGDVLHIGLHAVVSEPLVGVTPHTAATGYKLQLFQFFNQDVTRSDLPAGLCQMLATLNMAQSVGVVVATSTEGIAPSVTIDIDIDPLADVTYKLLGMKVEHVC